MPLVSQSKHYIWRKVDAVPNGFEVQQNISTRAFAALSKINTTFVEMKRLSSFHAALLTSW